MGALNVMWEGGTIMLPSSHWLRVMRCAFLAMFSSLLMVLVVGPFR